ncbi:hypothetical protein GGC64_005098 [Mycobacterium sp. OAS707]|nr:hypothetical protein [Mycobacterium sp. OAS707]
MISIDERQLAEMTGDSPAGIGRATRGGPQIRSQ